jgi:transposase
VAVDTLGLLLAAVVTAANEPDRKQVAALCSRVQEVTGPRMQVAYADQGYTGEEADHAAAVPNMDWQVMAKPEGPTGVGLLPRRWVVARRFGWASRFRRLARDDQRLARTRQPFHFLAFGVWLLAKGVFQLSRP